jgi:hypothetical protein
MSAEIVVCRHGESLYTEGYVNGKSTLLSAMLFKADLFINLLLINLLQSYVFLMTQM